MRRALATTLFFALSTCVDHPSFGRDLGQWTDQPPEVREWYRNAELTLAARLRFPFVKCCDGADVVRTRFEVSKTDGRDVWLYEDTPGHMKRIPDDIIHWNESAPGGAPTLFVYGGKETCFFPPDAGI